MSRFLAVVSNLLSEHASQTVEFSYPIMLSSIVRIFCLLPQVLYQKLPPNVSDLEVFGYLFCLLNFFDNILCGRPFHPSRSMKPLLALIIKILITKSCWLGVPHHRGPPSLSSRRGKWFLFKRSQGLLMPHSLTLMPPLWFFFISLSS